MSCPHPLTDLFCRPSKEFSHASSNLTYSIHHILFFTPSKWLWWWSKKKKIHSCKKLTHYNFFLHMPMIVCYFSQMSSGLFFFFRFPLILFDFSQVSSGLFFFFCFLYVCVYTMKLEFILRLIRNFNYFTQIWMYIVASVVRFARRGNHSILTLTGIMLTYFGCLDL